MSFFNLSYILLWFIWVFDIWVAFCDLFWNVIYKSSIIIMQV